MSNEMTPFERYRTLSIYWFNMSSDLRGSAAALFVSVEQRFSDEVVAKMNLGAGFSMGAATPRVARMLCGLSLELLYKAVIVAREKDVPTKHDLVMLAALAAVPTSETDRGLLEILTAAIVWSGRYPVPKDETRFEELRQIESERLWARDQLRPSGLTFARPNGALGWVGFDRLWREASLVYWSLHVDR